MAQVILNLEFDEFLRTFTAEAKKERFCLLLQGGEDARTAELRRKRKDSVCCSKGSMPCPGSPLDYRAKRYERTERRTDSRSGVRTMS